MLTPSFSQISFVIPKQTTQHPLLSQQSKCYQGGKALYATEQRTSPLASLKQNPAEPNKSCFLVEEVLMCSKQP